MFFFIIQYRIESCKMFPKNTPLTLITLKNILNHLTAKKNVCAKLNYKKDALLILIKYHIFAFYDNIFFGGVSDYLHSDIGFNFL